MKKSLNENSKVSKENGNLQDENRKLQEENQKLKKANEENLLAIVDLQNALKNKGEELQMKAEIHEKEVKAISSQSETTLRKIGDMAKQQYEKKLQEAIKHLRHDCEKQMDQNKKELDRLHQIKENDLKQHNSKLSETLKSKFDEIKDVSSKVEESHKKIAKLEGDKHSLEKKLKGVEEHFKETEKKLEKEIKEMEKEIKELEHAKNKLIAEYQDLMEIKVALDNEIATYRSLLESEEDRYEIQCL